MKNVKYIFAMIIPILIYQNCAKTAFSISMNSELSAGNSMLIEDGRPATHNKILKVQFLNVDRNFFHYTKMRITEESQFTEDLPWEDYNESSTVDLKSAWASHGEQDKVKNIIAELKDGETIVKLSAQILLDTLPPIASNAGLMATGVPSGKVYVGGDLANLAWTAQDVDSPTTGLSSGIDPDHGVRVGWSKSANCDSTSVNFVSEWGPNTDSFKDFQWPSLAPADTFYVCVIVQDRAQNQFTLLSQPMTSLWQVLAGDNNQGNGGSVLASNVRMNYPTKMIVDSSKNIFFADAYFNSIRKITADGYISLVAGTGESAGVVAGDALSSPISAGSMAIDSRDLIYFTANGYIWRYLPNADAKKSGTLEKWMGSIPGSITLVIDKSSDTLFVSNYTTTQSVDSSSYIYKLSISEIDKNYPSSSSRPGIKFLKANAIFAGNGQGLASSTIATDTRLGSASLDYPAFMALGDEGELYYASRSDGVGYPFGHQQLRLLKKDPNGVLQNYLITPQVAWANDLTFIHTKSATGAEQKYLLAPTDTSGLKKIDLLSGTVPVASAAIRNVDPYPTTDVVHPVRVGGVVVLYDAKKQVQSILFSESSNSRLTVLNSNLEFIATYGRAMFDPAQNVATESMVNNPDGIAQTENGDVYMFESLSHIIRKVDNKGMISLVAGTPRKSGSITDNKTYSFMDVLLNGYGYTNGLRYEMSYDTNLNRIYLQNGNRILAMNLIDKTLSTYGPTIASNTTNSDGWFTFSAALAPASLKDEALYIGRYNMLNPNQGAIFKKYSSSSNEIVGGTGAIGPITKNVLATQSALPGGMTASVLDSQKNFYFSGGGGLYEIDAKTQILSQIASASYSSLVLFEESDGSKNFIGTAGNSLRSIKINADGSVVSKTMCLVGTFLNQPRQVAKSQDGNILISDSHNSRVLKYFIRDSAGTLKVMDSKCQP